MLRIRDQVKAVLGEDSSCVLEAAAECSADLDARAVRVACKDARAQDPLRLHKSRPGSLHGGSAAHLALTGAHGHGHGHVHVHHPTRPLHGHGGHGGLGRHRRNVSSEVAQELGLGPLEQVEMTVDNTMSSEHTVITLVVPDRKGLTYDIMRVLKDQEVRIAYGRIGPEGAEGGRTVIDLFLQQEFESRGICDQDLIDDLAETLRLAVAMPITVTIADVFDGACTQVPA